ncbi:MAG TPA: hypothetical protein VJQ49_12180, partial [Casimicrobiaceae bacterium]|nr:hypothetical protein [Casimicrobiaceae bacterium]
MLALGSIALAEPLAVETIFRRPAYTDVKLSPDGSKMAALVPVQGRRGLAVVDLLARKAVAVAGSDDSDVSYYSWISNDRLIVEQANLADASGEIRLLGRGAIDADGRNARRLPYWGASVVAIPGGDDIIMWRYVVSRGSSGAYRVNTRTADEELLTWDNPGDVVQWVPDHRGNIRVAVSVVPRSNRTTIYARPRGDGPWHEVASYATDASERILPIAFDLDDRMLYVWSNRGR